MSLIEQAIREADLGDARRNVRALRIVAGMVRGQTSDTNAATPTGMGSPWAHAMGAYRLFNHDELTLAQLHAPVRAALAELSPKRQPVLVVHDFSVLDYSKHTDKKDRIQVGNERGLGYDLYTALVLDEQGRPLGPIAIELRTAQGCLSTESDTPIPFVHHLEEVERGVDAAMRHLPECELVHVGDREFDDVLLLRRLRERSQRYVIRALNLGRVVQHAGHRRTLLQITKALARTSLGIVEHDGKTFEQWVGETTVTFDRPALRGVKHGARPTKGEPLDVRVVVTELRGVDTSKRYAWVLLTNLEEPIERVVAIYRARWQIERFFYFTKVGLRLEAWRQRTGEATARRLAITMLAAMALYQLQATKDEVTLKKVATLGGWLGRKRDAMGPVVLMRGMLALLTSLDAIAQHGLNRLVHLAESAGFGFAVPPTLRAGPSAAHPRPAPKR